MKLGIDWSKRKVYDGHIMPVAVVNPEDLHPPERIVEEGPEHWVTLTMPIPVLSTVQLLELDPLRAEAVLSIVGNGQLSLCHSLNQANSDAKGQSISGAVFGAGISAAGGGSTVTVGSQTSPGAGTVITSQALAAGTYTVGWSVQLSGTLGAGDANNFGLYNGATLVATSLNAGAAGTYPQPPLTVVIPAGGATLAIKAIGAGTVGAVYQAQLATTLQAAAASGTGEAITIRVYGGAPLWAVGLAGSALSVGIFQMRRQK